MKYILLAMVLSTACLAETKRTLPMPKDRPAELEKKQLTGKAAEALKAEEDCDDKAKKEVEIVPEAVGLGSGGCTLDEAH